MKKRSGSPLSATGRVLRKEHFAFIRAVAQGVDAQKGWERYLRSGEESSDIRKVRSAIAWVRSEFAAAARRHRRPHLARLILIDVDQIAEPKLPSLDEFARESGMEDFSEEEIREAYSDAFGGATRKTKRRTQLVNRQLVAIDWLEGVMSPRPRPGDPVADWLTPAVAERLVAAGMPTLFTVAERINSLGYRWWSGLPAIGAVKAATVLRFFEEHEESLGLAIGRHALQPHTALSAAQQTALVPSATALVPIEKLIVPSELNGRTGRYRADPLRCTLAATDDLAAVREWLDSKAGAAVEGSAQTYRAYRKEAERLLLWCVLEAQKPLSSLDMSDALAYRAFMANPPPSWCGLRQNRRWSPQWRPFEGPLAPSAQRTALLVLRSLFGFLKEQNYLLVNPFSASKLPPASTTLGSSRVLSEAQWKAISNALDATLDSELGRRRSRAIRWFYATGLRLSELASARCGALRAVRLADAKRRAVVGVLLTVVGKGRKTRDVPIPRELVRELERELARFGRPPNVLDPTNADVPILARFTASSAHRAPAGWSDSGISKAVHGFMQRCALQLDGEDRATIMKATTHWLRHTHASHALNGQEGVVDSAMPIPLVRQTLGHSSLATTSAYIQADQAQHIQAMERFWDQHLNVGQ